ncbi:MAG: tyrosine recombinase XerC [Oscillospiraceae bacterium]|nr:tyrosine recombinase XerC [Oscillospiraceae bacterium]
MEKIWGQAPEILYKFLIYIQTIKGKSSKTVDEYFFDLRTFFRFMKARKQNLKIDENLSLSQINIDDVNIEFIKSLDILDIYEYMSYVANNRNNHAAARSRKTSSLRSFFKYLTIKIKVLNENPIDELETPKIKKSLPKFLSLEESKLLLEVIKNGGGKFVERDYCMVVLFLNCGMRLSELVGINLLDIESNNTLRLIGKGNKERIIYLNDCCVQAIENYKKTRKDIKQNALFISRNKCRISTKTVQFLMKKYFKLAGFSNRGFSTHKLRHTAATLMYQYGNVDIRVLKEILGHENIATTEIYTHTSAEQLKKAADSNPLNGGI